VIFAKASSYSARRTLYGPGEGVVRGGLLTDRPLLPRPFDHVVDLPLDEGNLGIGRTHARPIRL
jgi:hypothetical protein